MNMPGFVAESSLCQTNNRYGSAGGSFPNNSNPTVAPQGCGLVDAIVCGGLVGSSLWCMSWRVLRSRPLGHPRGCDLCCLRSGGRRVDCTYCLPRLSSRCHKQCDRYH
jgi:hypothetical protein